MKKIRLSRCRSMLSSLHTLCLRPSSEPGDGKAEVGGFLGPRHGATRLPRTVTLFTKTSCGLVASAWVRHNWWTLALKEPTLARAVLFVLMIRVRHTVENKRLGRPELGMVFFLHAVAALLLQLVSMGTLSLLIDWRYFCPLREALGLWLPSSVAQVL